MILIIRIAIRDDDTNFFTNPDDLKFVYENIEGFPISFAVIPYVTGFIGGCPEAKGNVDRRGVSGNRELVEYLKTLVVSREGEILMHGITHEYRFANSMKIPEMLWIDIVELKTQLPVCKKYLEDTFDCKINCFVAPSNKITKRSILEIANLDMNFSGITQHFDRQVNFRYLRNYVKRWTIRAISKIPYPGVLDYGTHFEINACRLDSKDYLMDMYRFCKKHTLPMVINTHYWHLRDNPKISEWFIEFIQYAVSDGAIPSTISQCINDRQKRINRMGGN